MTPKSLALVFADEELKAWRAFAARVKAMADAAEKLDRPALRFIGHANNAVAKLNAKQPIGRIGS
jgi:hypothetical protein